MEQSSQKPNAKRLATQLVNAGSMPPGVPRTKATLDVALQAKTLGEESLEARARLELIACYVAANNSARSLESFSQTLSQMLRNPQLFTRRQLQQLFLLYPEVCRMGVGDPAVPASLLEYLFAGYQALDQDLSPSNASYYYLRHICREALGYKGDNTEFLNSAVEAVDSSDSLALRRAIDIAQIEMAVVRGEDKAAIKIARRMISHDISGSHQTRLARAIMLPLLREEAWQEAWEAHLVAYRGDRDSGRLANIAPHFTYLAASGNYQRLLDLLVRHLPLIRKPKDPWDLLVYLRALHGALELLELAGKGKIVLPVSLAAATKVVDTPPLFRPTITRARQTFGDILVKLATRFDERNSSQNLSAPQPMLEQHTNPASVSLEGNDGDERIVAKLLRARALLESDQAFDALILLDSLANSKAPAARKLSGQIQLLRSWGRIDMNRNAATMDK